MSCQWLFLPDFCRPRPKVGHYLHICCLYVHKSFRKSKNMLPTLINMAISLVNYIWSCGSLNSLGLFLYFVYKSLVNLKSGFQLIFHFIQLHRYPTMQQLGEDLINILDNLRVKTVIGLGDGAGANIMTRFEVMHHNRCLGVLLVNPTATAATFMEQFKVKAKNISTNNIYLLFECASMKL